MDILINFAFNESFFAFELEPFDRVETIISRVKEQAEISFNIRLIYNGKTLELSRALSDYDIIDGAIIKVVRQFH